MPRNTSQILFCFRYFSFLALFASSKAFIFRILVSSMVSKAEKISAYLENIPYAVIGKAFTGSLNQNVVPLALAGMIRLNLQAPFGFETNSDDIFWYQEVGFIHNFLTQHCIPATRNSNLEFWKSMHLSYKVRKNVDASVFCQQQANTCIFRLTLFMVRSAAGFIAHAVSCHIDSMLLAEIRIPEQEPLN